MAQHDDAFVTGVRKFFLNLAANRTLLLSIGAVIILAFVLSAGWLIYSEQRVESSQRAFFEATKGAQPKPTPSATPAAGAAEEPGYDVVKLQAVAESQRGTIAGLQAALLAGKLTLEKNQLTEAEALYALALKSAREPMEKAASHYGLALAHMQGQNHLQAVEAFESAARAGETAFRARAMLGVARSKALAKDIKGARDAYDKILVDLPNTPEAATAELEKSKLGS